MDKRKPAIDGAAVAKSDNAPEQPQPKIELPVVESPSISPAEMIGATNPVAEAVPVDATEAANATNETTETEIRGSAVVAHIAASKRPRVIVRPRHKRYAVLAASVAIAAASGAIIGAAASGGFSKPVVDVAAVEENKATHQSVARLTKEIASLKTSLEAANKSASSQIAKISERLSRESASITASVPTQPTVQAAHAPAPLPMPRPEVAGAETQTPARLAILTDWSIRETRDGYVYVQGHGDVYQVVPGAPLPGLGPVEQIKRQDGRWLVVTPKGIIVSMRDRRYFEQF